MREGAVCSIIYISLTSPLLSFFPHYHRWTTKPGMDKRRHLPKRQVTVSIGTSPYVSFPFPPPSPLLLPIALSILQVVLAAKMARRLISVTGQWASDCQLNRPCVLVGSLRIQAHSHRLTGPHTEPLQGVPPLPSCAEKKKNTINENLAFHSGLTHKQTGVQLHTYMPIILDAQTQSCEAGNMIIWFENIDEAR